MFSAVRTRSPVMFGPLQCHSSPRRATLVSVGDVGFSQPTGCQTGQPDCTDSSSPLFGETNHVIAPSVGQQPQQTACATHSAATAATPMNRIPVIIDTDIGSDIDDTWALAMALGCPEIDVRMVVTCTGDTHYRAKIVCKFLERVGRTDIPVGIGLTVHPSCSTRLPSTWRSAICYWTCRPSALR